MRQALVEIEKVAAGKRYEEEKKQARVSEREPEARRRHESNGGWATGYNAQFATDAKEKIVVGVELTADASDAQQLEPTLADVERRLEQRPRQVLADAGYNSRANIEAMEAAEIEYAAPAADKGSQGARLQISALRFSGLADSDKTRSISAVHARSEIHSEDFYAYELFAHCAVFLLNQSLGNSQVDESPDLSRTRPALSCPMRGSFSFPLLPPGVYKLNVEAKGFQNPRKRIVVQTDATTRVEIELAVDILEQVVEALDTLPELRYDWHGVDGVVSRFQIENLPLNGREFLQLSILEPGVTAAPRAGFFTRQFDLSVLGGSPNDTRYTLDGSPIYNPLTGGTPQNVSQEVVQKFQVKP